MLLFPAAWGQKEGKRQAAVFLRFRGASFFMSSAIKYILALRSKNLKAQFKRYIPLHPASHSVSGSFVRPRAGSAPLFLEGLNTRTQKREYPSTKNSLATPMQSPRPQRTSSRSEARGQKQQAAHELHTLKAFCFTALGLHPTHEFPQLLGTILPDLIFSLPVTSLKFSKKGYEQDQVQESLQIHHQFFENLALLLQNVLPGRFLQEHSACCNCKNMTETMAKSF